MYMFILEKFLEIISLYPFYIIFFFFNLIFLYKWFNKNNLKKLPPSPPKLPIIGNLHQLGTSPHRSLKTLSMKYGELMLLHLGSTPTLVVSSSKAAREIMKTHDLIFSNRPYSRKASKLLYDSKDVAFAKYGEYWRQMKSICVLQLLSSSRVRSFRAIREEEIRLMVDNIRRLEHDQVVVNLSEMLIKLTNNVVCKAAFGRKYSGKEGGDFKDLMYKFVEVLGTFSVRDFVPWLGWVDKMNGLDEKVDKVAKEFDVFLERVVDEHVSGLKEQENGYVKGEKGKDFVDVLLEVQRYGDCKIPFDRDSIKAIILDIFAAGTDTTYTGIEWAMSELLKHPKELTKLQQEVRSIARGKTYINEDDLQKMLYLKSVIKETLRLHPPIPLLLFRESTQDIKIKGYDITAKTQVIINAWTIQRDPCIWKDPDVFKPERFLTSTVDFKGHDYELIPFGAGRRSCPGIVFVTSITELVLANLVNEFDWILPGGGSESLDMNETCGLTIHRKNPLLAIASPQCCK